MWTSWAPLPRGMKSRTMYYTDNGVTKLCPYNETQPDPPIGKRFYNVNPVFILYLYLGHSKTDKKNIMNVLVMQISFTGGLMARKSAKVTLANFIAGPVSFNLMQRFP